MSAVLATLTIVMGGLMVSTNECAAQDGKALADFIERYEKDYQKMYCDVSYSWWDAVTTGSKEAFDRSAAANLALSKYHASPEKFAELKRLRENAGKVDPRLDRAAYVAFRAFEESQFSPELMKKMTDLSSDIEQTFQTQRCKLDGKEYTNNELLEMLAKETDSRRRYMIWDALKEVGQIVAPRLIELAKLRNQAARELGYHNFWEMSVTFQDYKPEALVAIFRELETLTTPVFKKCKAELDAQLMAKFKVDRIMPWHYDNPFFQAAQPSAEVDPDEFFRDRKKEDIVEISIRYYDTLGIDVRPIVAKSDLFERKGKSQHGFCNNMNGEGDVRILCNVKPTAEWMDTQLHELGHAIYDYGVDRSLPFNIRQPAHIFTTEGVAMMFGAKAKDPNWLVRFAGVPEKRAREVAGALKKQRLLEQLVFCRWCLVMLDFEKAFYENPEQDLNTLWWDTVERLQMMPRPENRNRADWASKPHFVIAPVYYHNYMLGELFGAQVRRSLEKRSGGDEKEFGRLLREKVFKPGDSLPWEEFVKEATGEPLSPRAFAEELK